MTETKARGSRSERASSREREERAPASPAVASKHGEERTERGGEAALTDPLEPLRLALMRSARDEATALVTQADETASRVESAAREEAARIREQARARGAVDATDLVAAQRSQASREARAVVLAAHRAEYDALRSSAREAVAALSVEPDYPLVRKRMVDVLRGLLGDGASIADAPGGGVTATVPGRSADFGLARLADRAVDRVLAEELS
jgi:vacuolar-type H+-ATPase subunit H